MATNVAPNQIINNSSDEIIILKTICEVKQFQGYIFSVIDETFFNIDATKEIYGRILTYIQNGKEIPSILVWRNDFSLSEPARVLFSSSDGYLTNKDDIDQILESLRVARNKKLIITTLVEILNPNKPLNIVSSLTTLENLIQKCRKQSDTDEFKHYTASNLKKLKEEADKQLSEDLKKVAIPSGFTEFDTRTGGLFRGNVLAIAAPPGGGKSAMALQMAIYQYTLGYNVCMVTYEMDVPELDNRLYANVSKVNHTEINLKKLDTKKKKLVLDRYGDWLASSTKGNKFSIWAPRQELTIPQIAMELKLGGYDVIYIDYLSLLFNNPRKALWENLGEHTRAAKLAANSLNAVIVVLAQLDDESNRIKYSKAIKANANFIWSWEFGDKERESGVIEVNQQKARNAPIYNFYLETDYSIFSFKDYNGPRIETEAEVIKKRKKDDNNLNTLNNLVLPGSSPKPPTEDRRGIPKMPQLL